MTTLDEIPRNFRCAPGLLALNAAELKLLEANDGETFKRILAIVHAEDAADARLMMQTPKRRKQKLSPSIRLSMVNAIYAGRR